MAYFFIALTILLTVYGQLVLKWQVGLSPHLLATPIQPKNILTLLLNPWVISAFAAAFGASLCWMAAISRMSISKAYPFMAINFLLVAIMAVVLFREQLDNYKIAGTALIMLGVLVLSRSAT
ncbi:hypothetical protein CO615_05395 [Lysobacteraceae bacterium NML75-0749]|nr:hypothetical protein CO615_05395 [Xanthomonadaceae bacterium NML75-0749]PJK04886.1 hypothetical protein CO609_04355 [Xanthomonadaceae bacterium NML91-0268]PJK07078.1 hypothetical protein CO612_00925 [Xanthomonadaceae bacterium NML71-0210]